VNTKSVDHLKTRAAAADTSIGLAAGRVPSMLERLEQQSRTPAIKA
jgi:hypothetical protein